MTAPAAAPPVRAWRFFDARVTAAVRLSPSFVRLTLSGPDLHAFADNGWDQRFKLVLPDRNGGYDSLPRDPEWYATWRLLPPDRKNPIRTYTVRAVRPGVREVDVDLVLHGDAGPASRFAGRTQPGDDVVLLGPNAEHGGPHGGLEFRPPAGHMGPTLLVGDPTATPAVLSILGQLPAGAFGEAVLEVPTAEDVTDVQRPPDMRLTWLVQRGPVSGLTEAVGEALRRVGVGQGTPNGALLHGPVDGEPLWDVPEDAAAAELYAWVAGESGLVTRLRRWLVRDLGVDRRSVAFMGYWRRGLPGG